MPELDTTGVRKWKVLLSSVEFFSVFDDSELEIFLKFGEVSKFKARDIIIRENSQSTALYIILKGKVNIIKDTGKRITKTIGSLSSGYAIGEMALLLNEKRTATIMAAEDTFLYGVDFQSLDELDKGTQVKLYKQLAVFLSLKLNSLSKIVAEELMWR